MEKLFIRISNYRNIDSTHPVEIEVRNGISFILGLNNLGKSNILKFFWEMRPVLLQIAHYIQSGNTGNLTTPIKLPVFLIYF